MPLVSVFDGRIGTTRTGFDSIGCDGAGCGGGSATGEGAAVGFGRSAVKLFVVSLAPEMKYPAAMPAAKTARTANENGLLIIGLIPNP